MKKVLILVIFTILCGTIYYYSTHIRDLSQKIQTLEKKETELEILSIKSKADSLLLLHHYDTALHYYGIMDSISNTTDYTEKAWSYINEQKLPFDKINQLEKRYYHKEIHIKNLKRNQVHLYDSIKFYKKNNQVLAKRKGDLEENIEHNQKEIKNLKKELVLKEKEINRLEIVNHDGAEIKYIGEVLDGQANGFGYAVFEKKGFYEGYWENNSRNGQGQYTWENGDRYEGNFKNGTREGFGVYYFVSGERYEGFWSDNLREGFGVIFDKEDKKIFEGIWKKDKPKNKKNSMKS
ncbi:hypothetical protein [Flammeovirga aprica]|uniref:MORN repeat-containing protein 3 n=1 Tax=Flammeovirga aprica JL-4 TaxID=694437 RepID=A0A7X9P3K8_9BACT|nr:hypothetical protein [Flammeovirga aprica]NME68765.1 hypothetical protein [Flammeovirga aprica JL-4]